MTYLELKQKHREEFESFPIIFAFSTSQLEEGLRKLNCTKEELRATGAGGFIRKTDTQALRDLINRHAEETTEAFKDDSFLTSAIKYELANHEYCITHDPEPTMQALGLDLEDITGQVRRCFNIAKTEYLSEYYEWERQQAEKERLHS
jgi:hypothetical protein